MSLEEKLGALHEELDEWKETLSELRRRLADPNEISDEEVGFHQDVLVKMQHTAHGIEMEINKLTPIGAK